MREISLPIPQNLDEETAEITVSTSKNNHKFHFRIEAFDWGEKDVEQSMKIENLRQAIVDYDENFELIQIYTPAQDAKFIQVLFRKKSPA